jgi:hypothetical protein
MAQNPEDRQQWVATSLGRGTDPAFLAEVAVMWDLHDGVRDLRLKTLYTRLDAIDFLAGEKLDYHDYDEAGVSESYGQVPRNLDFLRQSTQKAIDLRVKQLAGRSGPRSGLIAATSVLVNPAGLPDPNARVYRGDALERRPVDPLLVVPPGS